MRYGFKMDSSKAIAKIEQLQKRMPQAIARGLNSGGDLVKTQVQRSLKTQTGLLKYRAVTARVRTTRAYGDNAPASGIGPTQPGKLAYTIIVSGKATRPADYKVIVQKGKGGGVIVYFWNKPHRFVVSHGGTRSFEIQSGDLAGKLKMRKTEARFPMRGFYGPDLAKEVLKDPTREVFFKAAETLVMPAIVMQITRLLK